MDVKWHAGPDGTRGGKWMLKRSNRKENMRRYAHERHELTKPT